MDRFLHNDNVLRILALVLACAIWLGVNSPGGGQAAPSGLSQPFAYLIKVDTPAGMVATSVNPAYADVIVTGDAGNVATVQAQMAHVGVVADATGLTTTGSHTVNLQLQNMPALAHTVDPAAVTVVLKAMQTVQVPLRVHVTGQLAPGYLQGSPEFDRQSVAVSGSMAVAHRVVGVRADVSVSGKRFTFSENVQLIPLDRHGKRVPDVTVAPGTVTVTVPIDSPKLSADVVPQLVGAVAPGYAVSGITIHPKTVLVYGALPHQLPSAGGTKVPTVSVPVNVAGLRSDSTLPITLPTLPGVTRMVPTTVTATVVLEPSETKTMMHVPIRVTNLRPGEIVKLGGIQQVTLSLSGPKSMMDTLTAANVVAYVDVRHLLPGTPLAFVSVNLPQWIQVTQLSVAEVPVTVTK